MAWVQETSECEVVDVPEDEFDDKESAENEVSVVDGCWGGFVREVVEVGSEAEDIGGTPSNSNVFVN